jgi:Flp pilus assembly pilin Flp
MQALVHGLFDDDGGHDVIEYALIVSVVALAFTAGADAIGGVIAGTFAAIFGPVE